MPVVNELFRDVPDDDEGSAERTSEQRLMRVHRNLGHPSNRLLVQLLKAAKAPESVIDIASKLECPICARHVRTKPARPSNLYRNRELGHTVAMDFSYHTTPNSEQLMVLHFIDEASKCHVAKIIRHESIAQYPDLGNCGASDLVTAIAEWTCYFTHPACFHVDEEGCFHSEFFQG